MGMYDCINKEQVKCFCSKYFSKDYGLMHIGGDLICYKNGDKLPLKTMYYKYASNLAILDIRDYAKNDYLVHIIRDGKVFKTVYKKDLNNDDLNGIESFIDDYGVELNIKSKEDIENFIKEKYSLRKQLEVLSQDSRKLLDEMKIYLDNLTKLKTEKAIFVDFVEEEDIQKSSLKGLTLDEFKKQKASLLKDEELFKELRSIVLERIICIYKSTSSNYDNTFKELEKIIYPIKDKFKGKWIIDTYSKEMYFGALLYSFTNFLDDEGEFTGTGKEKDDYIHLLKKLIHILNEDETIIDSYIAWQSKDDLKNNEFLKNLLDCDFIKGLKCELENLEKVELNK